MSNVIQSISGSISSAAPLADVRKAAEIQQPKAAAEASPKPVMDEYVPEEKQESPGLYRLGRDEDGQPKIYFDDPESKAESCTCNTDSVDREIESLKRKQEELNQQINSEADPSKIKELERKLAQTEQELSQKDNDSYRRQHAVFS